MSTNLRRAQPQDARKLPSTKELLSNSCPGLTRSTIRPGIASSGAILAPGTSSAILNPETGNNVLNIWQRLMEGDWARFATVTCVTLYFLQNPTFLQMQGSPPKATSNGLDSGLKPEQLHQGSYVTHETKRGARSGVRFLNQVWIRPQTQHLHCRWGPPLGVWGRCCWELRGAAVSATLFCIRMPGSAFL